MGKLKPYSMPWFEDLRREMLDALINQDCETRDLAKRIGVPWRYVVSLKARDFRNVPREVADRIAKALLFNG